MKDTSGNRSLLKFFTLPSDFVTSDQDVDPLIFQYTRYTYLRKIGYVTFLNFS